MRNFFVIQQQQQLFKCFTTFCAGYPQTGFDLVERSCPVVPCLHRTANLAPEFFLSGPLFHPAIGQENDSVAFLVHMSCKEEAINAFSALNGKSIMRGRGCPCDTSHPAMERPHLAGISQAAGH